MFDHFTRLIATAVAFVAVTLGFELAPSLPTTPEHVALPTLDSLDLAEGLQEH